MKILKDPSCLAHSTFPLQQSASVRPFAPPCLTGRNASNASAAIASASVYLHLPTCSQVYYPRFHQGPGKYGGGEQRRRPELASVSRVAGDLEPVLRVYGAPPLSGPHCYLASHPRLRYRANSEVAGKAGTGRKCFGAPLRFAIALVTCALTACTISGNR